MANSPDSAMLKQVLDLHGHGLSIIPLQHKGKRPAIEWEAYQRARPTLADVKGWFGNGTLRNVGIVTGAVSGVVVLDVDREDMLPMLGDVPKTPTARTSKGRHIYFRHPGFDVSNFELPCGDVRGDGGQVVAPPSIHPSGAAYAWFDGLSFDDVPLAEMPDWLLELVRNKAKPPASIVRGGQSYDCETSEYGKAWFEDCLALARKSEPGRNNLLNAVACKAGSLNASGHLNKEEAYDHMIEATKQNGLYYARESAAAKGVFDTIHSGFGEGLRNPRYPLETKDEHDTHGGIGKLNIRKASEIKPEKVSWLWDGVLARGTMAIIAGNPGLGKSQVSLSVAAAISSGGYWPVSRQRATPGNVIILSIEDRAEDTIVPRLIAAGADLERVQIVTTVTDEKGDRQFNLAKDIGLLKDTIAEIGSVDLIIIDPITAYLGNKDANSTGDVRGITSELSVLAQANNACVLAVSHLNKKADAQASHRVLGSVSWVGAARTGFIVERRDDTELRVMAPMKNNIADDKTAFAFTVQSAELENGIKTSFVVWENYSQTTTADQVLADKGEDVGARDEAKEFLRSMLEHGPMHSVRILALARDNGISEKTLRRAKSDLKIGSKWNREKEQHDWVLPAPVA